MEDKLTYVIDVDGTLSYWNDDRDYINFKPRQEVIDKINKLYEDGHTIIINTARGMNSLNGDMDKIREEVYPVLSEWLKNNGVKYHKLIMNKPWGHFYVDDRNLSIEDFLKND